jgi:hypothetical protein
MKRTKNGGKLTVFGPHLLCSAQQFALTFDSCCLRSLCLTAASDRVISLRAMILLLLRITHLCQHREYVCPFHIAEPSNTDHLGVSAHLRIESVWLDAMERWEVTRSFRMLVESGAGI